MMTLYHFARRDGTPLFLHPFLKPGSTLEITSTTELQGKYGAEPRVESLTLLRNDLYRRIESDVRTWINERRFIPRFLISSAVFMLVFLFMSLVLRDPIPIVDEFLVSGGLAVFTYLVVGRRFEHSRTAGDVRVMLRSKVDGVVFTESPFVREVEELLHYLEERSEDLRSGPDDYAIERARNFKSDYPEDSARVITYLRILISRKPYRDLQKQMRRPRFSGKTMTAVENGTMTTAVVLLLQTLQRA
jgi:hypothetical protein